MLNMRDALANLGLVLVFVPSWAVQVSAAPITTFNSPTQFRLNNGPNSVGLPEGDQQFVGIQNVSPTAGTVVTATQGAVTRLLPFVPFTAFPTLFRAIDPFDPSLTGAWSITATNGLNVAGPILTNPITNPQLVPLVQNLQVVGTGATPTITWTLPDLAGFGVDLIRFRAYNDATDDLFLNTVIPVSSTAFTIPGGLLVPGVPYVFTVILQNPENSSATFTQSAYLVPEPGTGALLGVGLAALASRRRRGRRVRA